MMSSQRNLFEFLCISLTCIACYYNSTQCGLVFDDISAIRDNKDLRPTSSLRNVFLNDFWGTPMRKEQSHKSYRPLTVLTFRLNYLLHSLEPFGYHLVNVVLHVVVCLLWRRVCRLLLHHCAGFQNSNREPILKQLSTPEELNNAAFIAALLFAVHPVHTEAVTGIVGRAELLSSIFYLAAFLSYVRAVQQRNGEISHKKTSWLWLFVCFSSCLLSSMLSKEQGITIAAVCAVYEVFVVQPVRPVHLWYYFMWLFEDRVTALSPKSSPSSRRYQMAAKRHLSSIIWSATLFKRLAFLIFVTIALLVLRVYVMGSQLPVFTRFDNPASAAATPIRQLTYSHLIYVNSMLLIFPNKLCCDWTMGTIPLITGIADMRNMATIYTLLSLTAITVQALISNNLQQTRMLLMSLAWCVLPFLPASNLFFPVGFVVAERVLYIPSMGFCLLVSYGFMEWRRAYGAKSRWLWSVLQKGGLALLLVTHALKTHYRNYDWRTEYTLFMSGIHVNGRNAKLFNNVGHALEHEGNYNEALLYFQEAVRIQADDIGAHINVGRTYNNLKMYRQAEEAYMRAKALFPKAKPGESYHARIAPNHLNVFINLANLISKNTTRLEEADHLYRQAISMRADYVQAYINRGDILMKLNRTAQAQEVYEQALLYDSDNADIYYNLGVVFLEQGKSQQANVYFNKAIELYPEHEQALLNSAILLQEMGGADARQTSRTRLFKVLAKDQNNEKVYFNLGMLAMDELNHDEAEQFFKRAIHLKSDFRSALFNLALLLADTNRPLDAVPYLNQLIRHHPSHIKGLILLGDIYINHMKDLDAAETCYRSILQYEPHNTQGLHNLCVVFVERKQLLKAGACLRYVQQLAPDEDYIQRHLEVVQARLQKINKLPQSAPERQAAYAGYDPLEFQLQQQSDSGKHKNRQANVHS